MTSNSTRETGEFVICNLKLFAVSDTRQKLIGVVNFPVDWKAPKYKAKNRQSIPFSKCIDNAACIIISTKLQDTYERSKTDVISKRMIPRPNMKTSKTFEEECNIMENFQEVDDEGQRPHESLGNATTRDTPIKRNALLNKQKSTHRSSRNPSP